MKVGDKRHALTALPPLEKAAVPLLQKAAWDSERVALPTTLSLPH
jgi:hypothetical protein